MTVRAMQIDRTTLATCCQEHLSTGPGFALNPAQLPGSSLSILILIGPEDGEDAIFRDTCWTILDLLMQTFGSRMNIILHSSGWASTKFGIW